jgi:Zn-dependent protease with chaperone function
MISWPASTLAWWTAAHARVLALAPVWPLVLLTYTLHAGVWALAAWALGRGKGRSSVVQHQAWRLAFAGPLVTTAIAFSPLAALLPSFALFPGAAGAPSSDAARALGGGARAVLRAASPDAASGAWFMAGATFLGASFVGLAWWLVSATWFARALRGRRPLEDRRVTAAWDDLRARTRVGGVRFTQSARARSPMTIGRREICWPASSVARLTGAELHAVLAHELAHLERGDGLWFPAVALVRALLWFHPLVRWTAAELSRTAELASDDRATQLTRDPLGLASALTTVAWQATGWSSPLALASGGGGRLTGERAGHLALRVRRLVGAAPVSPSACEEARRPRNRLVSVVVPFGLALGCLGLTFRAPDPVRQSAGRAPSGSGGPLPTLAHESAADLATSLQALAQRERAVRERLDQAQPTSSTGRAPADEPPSLQELRQELRHVRAMQAWTERRLVAEVDREAHSRRAAPGL